MATTYLLGTSPRFTATFRDRDGVLADPLVVRFKVLDPNSVTTTKTYGTDVEVVKDSTGIYHLDYTPADAGDYCWRAEGVGSVDTADEDDFTVDAGCFA